MALSYGFYNSIEGDRTYDAIQFGRIFDGLITDGIYANYEQGMAVMASENAGEVIIQPGRAWFNHTWSYNDANFVMAAPAPEVLLDRIDALVLDIDTSLAARENKFIWVTGEPSSKPVRPTLIHTATHNQYALCFVHRYPETTTIKAADITNAIGRETPLVAGVLNPIDVSNYITQWDDEFHTWENNTKTDFTTWRNTVTAEFIAWQTGEKNAFEAWEAIQEASYNAWITNIQAQQIQDKADWDDWYADLRAQLHDLPEDTAEYLQIEIDDLKGNMSGSIFNISTTNPSLEGKTVTVSNESGTDIVTSQFNENLRCLIRGYKSVGNITFSSTDGIQTASSTVDIPYFGNYNIPISFWAATIRIQGDVELAGYSVSIKDSNNVLIGTVTLDNTGLAVTSVPKADTFTVSTSYEGDTISDEIVVTEQVIYNATLSIWKATVNLNGSEDVANVVVTVKNSSDLTVGTVTLDSSGDGIFYAKKADEYTFIWTIGGDTMEVSLNVTEETTYSVEIYAGFNWRTWCTLGGVSTYGKTSLSDVFANEEEVRKLMTVHASADYLIDRVTHKLSDIDDFCVNDTAMKWIGLRDYVCDGLTAISGVWDKFLASDYWERILKDHVPVMTSDTTPYGTVVYGYSHGTYKAYNAFANNDQEAIFAKTNETNGYLGYKFTNPVKVTMVTFTPSSRQPNALWKVQKSNDGSTWVDVTEAVNYTVGVKHTIKINNDEYCMYYRLFASNTGHSEYTGVFDLQFYGRSLNVSVPVMTSDTAPYGTAFASSESSTAACKAWAMFDKVDTTSTVKSASSTSDDRVGYCFIHPVNIKAFYYAIKASSNYTRNLTIQYSDDGSTWYDAEIFNVSITGSSSSSKLNAFYFTLVNDYGQHRYWALKINQSASWGTYGCDLDFYGLDYSEREFAEGSTMKYIYDHGLEMVGLTYGGLDGKSGSITSNTDDTIFINNTSTVQMSGAYTTNKVNLSSYSLMKIRVKDYSSTSLNSDYGGMYAIGYDASSATYGWNNMDANSSYTSTTANPNAPFNALSLNISSVSTSAYLIVSAGATQTASGYNKHAFDEWWLE